MYRNIEYFLQSLVKMSSIKAMFAKQSEQAVIRSRSTQPPQFNVAHRRAGTKLTTVKAQKTSSAAHSHPAPSTSTAFLNINNTAAASFDCKIVTSNNRMLNGQMKNQTEARGTTRRNDNQDVHNNFEATSYDHGFQYEIGVI